GGHAGLHSWLSVKPLSNLLRRRSINSFWLIAMTKRLDPRVIERGAQHLGLLDDDLGAISREPVFSWIRLHLLCETKAVVPGRLLEPLLVTCLFGGDRHR